MEIIVFLSIVIAVVAVLTSIVLIRRVKKQIAEMTDALVDVKSEYFPTKPWYGTPFFMSVDKSVSRFSVYPNSFSN